MDFAENRIEKSFELFVKVAYILHIFYHWKKNKIVSNIAKFKIVVKKCVSIFPVDQFPGKMLILMSFSCYTGKKLGSFCTLFSSRNNCQNICDPMNLFKITRRFSTILAQWSMHIYNHHQKNSSIFITLSYRSNDSKISEEIDQGPKGFLKINLKKDFFVEFTKMMKKKVRN